MIRRRILPVSLVAVAVAVVACTDNTGVSAVPFGFVTVSAQKSGASFTAYPVGTFYDANGLSIPTASAPWDSCRQQTFSRTTVGLGDVYPSIGAGSSIQVKLAGRTDSLFPVAVGREIQYRLRGAGFAYLPGDSVSVAIPGHADGFPAISFKAKTAEALVVTDFANPPVGSRLDLRWNAGHDLNGTVSFSFRYGALSADTLNTQIYCQFKDDGADTVATKYMAAWTQAPVRTWVAARVRTYVAPVARSGFFDFISTFDLPTPTTP